MAKRIVSGIFILTALGALGVILAGAMTSGEQLIVRFLTAVTVAALALYVISDLRLQNEQDEPPAERNDPEAARPRAAATTQAPAVMATVTGSHRRDQLTRSHDTDPRPGPNFEAIEPVTARSRSAAVVDPTEAVTGSRLVPSTPGPSDRVVPPHPPRTMLAEPPGHNIPGPPEHDDVEVGPEFLTPPDERMPLSPGNSAIASTAFTYSGRLAAAGTEWPPKPPQASDHGEPDASVDDAEPRADVGAVDPLGVVDITDVVDMADAADAADAPTAELPLLTGLPGYPGYDDDSLLAMFDAELVHDDEESDDGTVPSGRRAHLFAVDTAEIPLAESDDDVGADDNTDSPSSAGGTADEPAEPPRPLIRRLEAAQYAESPRTDHLELHDSEDLVTTAEVEPLLPATTRSDANVPDKLTAAIRSGEIQVINSLISQGMLSTTGPITDRDVRTMVYVAFTSNELRKLILAGGTPDGVRAGDLDLGEVELFDESRFAPTPKRLYAGPPAPPVGAPETVLDLVALEKEAAAAAAASSIDEHELDDSELVPTLPTPRHLYRRADVDRVDQ